MKKINSATIAFTFAGSIVGAGFLSGQELWQFFGSYGKLGVVGFILALILQLALVYIILTYAKDSQTSEFDILIVKKEIKPLRYFFIFSELVFVFGVVMIMYAGSGSLLKTAFGLNDLVGSLIFATAITIVAFLGLNGITKILSATIPFLTILTLIISILALDKYGFPNLSNAQVTGKTARMVSRFRPQIPIIGLTTDEKAFRQLALSWGVLPMMSDEYNSVDILFYFAKQAAKESGLVKKGETVVMTGGTPIGKVGNSSLINVATL
jgi:hypothetical protein